jgi:chemotaxis protein histidine kinase CheA
LENREYHRKEVWMMAMQKAYNRSWWHDEPSDESPIDEDNLNNIEAGVDEVDNRILVLDTTKFDKTEAQNLVKKITFDRNTGVFRITYYNGTFELIDTMLEKLMVNFAYDYQTQQLVITLDDGTKQYVDLSALITQYEFLGSDTIVFIVQPDGKITAEIKNGSIGEQHLRPDYLADIRVESAKAAASAEAAKNSEKKSKESEQAAKASEEKSKESEQAAASSEQKSKKSEQAAASSEQKSKESEQAAASSEQKSKESEQAAASSASVSAYMSASASNSADLSKEYSDMARSYAVGSGGEVRQEDATDNSEFYCRQSHTNAALSENYYQKTKQAGEDAMKSLNAAMDNINKDVPKFWVNPEDGKLYHTPSRFKFWVNPVTGQLEWGLKV